jgi:hypothetical protein
MLRSISSDQFLEWYEHDQLELEDQRAQREADYVRGDWQAALVAWIIAEVNRDPKKRGAFKLADFLLKFEAKKEGPEQTWQDQKNIWMQIVQAWSGGTNIEKFTPKGQDAA